MDAPHAVGGPFARLLIGSVAFPQGMGVQTLRSDAVAAAAGRDRGHPLVQAVLQERFKSPLAEAGPAPVRGWTSWDILPLSTVDTAKSSLLHVVVWRF